jgi:hypothetical protein
MKIICHAIFVLFSVNLLFSSVPVVNWNGQDTLKCIPMIILKPIKLVDGKENPIVSPTIEPCEFQRLSIFPFGSYTVEKSYLTSQIDDTKAVKGLSGKMYEWKKVITDSTGILDIKKKFSGDYSNSISYAVFDVNLPDSLYAKFDFTFCDAGVCWVNGVNYILSCPEDTLKFAGDGDSRLINLKKGLNRFAIKLENKSGKWGMKLCLRSATPDQIKKFVMPKIANDSIRKEITKLHDIFEKLSWSSVELLKKIPNAQESLSLIIKYQLQNEKNLKYNTLDIIDRINSYSNYSSIVNTLIKCNSLILQEKDPLSNMRGAIGWAYYSHTTKSVVPFHAYVPEGVSKDSLRPMIIGLHGSNGESVEYMQKLGIDFNKRQAIVLSPTGRGNLSYRGPGEADVMDLITIMERTFPVDTNKIVLTGSSMGGGGVYHLLAKFPWKFSAGAPLCGWINMQNLPAYKDMPMWVFHGLDDRVVHFNNSIAFQKYFADIPNKRVTLFPKTGHRLPMENIFTDSMLNWLYSFEKDANVKSLNKTKEPFARFFSKPTVIAYDDLKGDSISELADVAKNLARVDFGSFSIIAASAMTKKLAEENNVFFICRDWKSGTLLNKSVQMYKDDIENDIGNNIVMYHGKSCFNLSNELAVLSIPKGISARPELGWLMYEACDVVIKDQNFGNVNGFFLSEKEKIAKGAVLFSINSRKAGILADTILARICVSGKCSRGIFVDEYGDSLPSGNVTLSEIHRRLLNTTLFTMQISGEDLLTVMENPKKKNKWGMPYTIYLYGFDLKTIDKNTQYEFVMPIGNFNFLENAKVVRASDTPVINLFRQ